jgi:epoxide hydrolase-like predicted phosphatase
MIKAIIFDVGGVLEDYRFPLLRIRKHTHLSVHDFVAKKLRIGLDQWFDAIDTAYADAIEGKISKTRELKIISTNLKISPGYLENLWIKAYKKYFRRNDKLFDVAKRLRENEYKTAILSDQHYISREVLISKKDSRIFNYIFVSCDLGMRKPNSKIYKLVLKKIHFKPSEIIFIDNQKWNILPAKKLGMKTVLFRNNKQTLKELRKLGVNI